MLHHHRLAACLWLLLLAAAGNSRAAEPLTTLEYRVTGQRLEVTPSALAVPKGIPGSVAVNVRGGLDTVPAGAFVQAILRGPAFDARTIVGLPNQPLLLPPLNLVGDYSLDNIRLVGRGGATLLEGSPSSVPVQVFDEVLVARVTSRPLSSDEIRDRGIVIDETNFRAVEFEVGFVVDGNTVPVRFPVVTPAFYSQTEIIPQAELDEALAEAERINNELSLGARLPPGLEGAALDIEVRPLNIQFVDPSAEKDLALSIPPIAGLVVIPGNIGFLNQFFSVQVFVENAAPANSGLSVIDISAELVLPKGEDRVAGVSYEEPGDDPLRFARVEGVGIQNLLPVTRAGADGQFGTGDDIGRLLPDEVGQSEFLVEGLREGLHVIDVVLRGALDGLAAGLVEVEGRAAGSVLVRNPNFSLAFSHPRTIRSGEPYEASATILNTSSVTANSVSITLPTTSISGAVLESEATVLLGDIAPGETRTATFQLRAQRTGSITFSNLSSDDDVVGRFRLRMGVDERGVTLSPDSIGYPEFVDDLPLDLFTAADRVLGQALSVATAARLPAGVTKLPKSFVTKKVIELAEAGQRLRYGDSLERVLIDLALDWQGARASHPGFEDIVRTTNAGREWRETLARLMAEQQPALSACGRLADRAADLAGRGEVWHFGASDSAEITVGSTAYTEPGGQQLGAARAGFVRWLAGATGDPSADLCALIVSNDGSSRLLDWKNVNVPAGAALRFDPGGGAALQIDADGDGTFEASVAGVATPIVELAPQLLGVVQDTSINSGRPRSLRCTPGDYENYGTIVAALYSKPMGAASVELPSSYTLDDGNSAGSVSIQPGGRVALLNLRRGVGVFRERTLTVSGTADPRGNTLDNGSMLVQTSASSGIAIDGRVVRADGSPAADVPVTLTYYEESGIFCDLSKIRPSQVRTDADGRFTFDFILAGPPYTLSSTDTFGLSGAAIDIILQGSEDDRAVRDKLLDLASQPGVQNTLLETFALGALPDAIAAAEGLDRALLRDVIDVNSPRQGSTVPVVLRFRGRGTVAGTVFAADGVTPVRGAAVNVFPDPGSREQGRGLVTGADGAFAFFGVPLGVTSIRASAPDGTARDLSGTLTQNGQVLQLDVVLSAATVETGTMTGRIFNADGATPHAFARIFIGRISSGQLRDVVAVASANFDGFWSARRVPEGRWDLVAISADGSLKGERRDILAVADGETVANVTLQGRSSVRGRVEFADGRPVPNAIVAGGLELVRTDALGEFVLAGVPTGNRSISAGLERDIDNGIHFPRIGNVRVDVLAGIETFAVVRFAPRGSITGKVFDAAGNPVAGVNVALPNSPLSFLYTRTNQDGIYFFENIGLRDWTVSAPAPPTSDSAEILDESLATLSGAARGEAGDQAALLSAITNAFAVFTGANDPLLNGEGENFNPLSWGFNEVSLSFDGQLLVADIVYLPEGTVSGTVLNGQGVPIGARVRLTGIGPTRSGDVGFIIRGERNSDPALGTFEFPGQALAGPFGLQAASPFFPVVITHDGRTTRVNPNASGIIMQFPAAEEINGRLVGRVFRPDGSPAADVGVKISFGDNFIIRTDGDGFFDTQIDLPAGGYQVEAAEDFDANFEAVGLRGQSTVTVRAGITNEVEVTLLDRGDLDILVTDNAGAPVSGAALSIRQVTFPGDTFDAVSDAQGRVSRSGLFAGHYSVRASAVFGPTTIRGSSAVCVVEGETAAVTVRLQPTGTIRGRFVEDDGVTPVGFAQIIIGGGIGFAATDAGGGFEVVGLPLGSYRLIGTDPVSGRVGSTTVQLSTDGEVREILLLVRSLGEIRGQVINSARDGFVPGAIVTYSPTDGVTAARSVTSGPDGSFAFAGAVEGAFSLRARHPLTGVSGSASGVLGANQAEFEIDVALSPRAEFSVVVLRPGGAAPVGAGEASVIVVGAGSGDTDADGVARFANLALNNYSITARSTIPGDERSAAARASFPIAQAGLNSSLTLTLSGVGSVSGTVFESDGTTPASGATVTLEDQSAILGRQTRNVVTGADGSYSFSNVAVADYRVSAASVALADSVNASISAGGESDTVDLTLGASGSVLGRLLRADGSPAIGIEAGVFFDSQSGALGVASDVTAEPDGAFHMSGIPVGPFDFEAIATAVNGIARLSGELSANGEELDLGDVFLDEAAPTVVSVTPADTSIDVPIASEVVLTFSEEIAAGSFDANGIYLCNEGGGSVAATLSLEAGGTVVRLSPDAPLQSETVYHLVALDGDRSGAGTGGTSARGLKDLVGRPLVVPFQSSFITADERPPLLLSFTPVDGASNIDPRSVIRFSFDEPMRRDGIAITLNGPGGEVPGFVGVGIDNRVISFVPEVDLMPNATYHISAQGFADLAGNAAVGQPFTSSFASLDTLGPSIDRLRIKGGLGPVANAAIELEVVLANPESGARVRMTADFVAIGETATPGDLDLPFTLPATGSVTIRAIAIDAFGNEGPLAQLVLTVQENMPPQVNLVRVNPASGPLETGQPFSVRVEASDDSGLAELRAASAGAAVVSLQTSAGEPIALTGVVAGDAGPGASVMIFASATDNSGLGTGEVSFEIPVVDGTPPTLAITAPDSGAEFAPGATFTVDFGIGDNFGVSEVTVDVGGAFVDGRIVPVTPAPGAATLSVDFTVPSDLPADGAGFTVTARATDAAGNQSPPIARNLRIPDLIPPTINFRSPTAGATQVGPVGFRSFVGRVLTVGFTEEIDPASVVPGSMVLTDSAGAVVPGSVTPASIDAWAEFTPDAPMRFGETYTLTVFDVITDLAGNPTPGGSASFSTVTFHLESPLDNTRVVEGQQLDFLVETDRGSGASRVEFTGPTGILATVNGVASANVLSYPTTLTIPLVADMGDPPFLFGADVRYLRNGGGVHPPLPVDPITLDVRGRDEDSDNDGIPNGAEVDNGLDPFRDDAAEDADGDNLSNAEEIAAGTDPQNADTDGDGLPDDIDDEPLVPNSGFAPVAGIENRGSALQFDGIDDYVHVAAFPAITGNLTVSVCFENLDDGSGDQNSNYLVADSPFSGSPFNDFSMRYAPGSGVVIFDVVDQAGNTHSAQSGAIEAGPHQATGIYDFDGGFVRLYIDGVQVDETAASGAIRNAGNRELFIGTFRGVSPLTAWNGSIDEVRIWNIARSQHQIRQDARRALRGDEPGLVAYYHFDEGAGDTAFDHTTNLNDARLGGGDPAKSPSWVAESKPMFGAPVASGNQDSDQVLLLDGFDPDGAALGATVTSLPSHGQLFQTTDGVTPGAEITSMTEQALAFDKTDQALFLPHTLIDGRDALTIQWSMRSDGSGACFISGARSANANAFILCNADGRIDLWEEGVNIASWRPDFANQWRTFAFVRDPAAGRVDLFVDGTSLGPRSVGLGSINIDPGGFVVGQEQDTVGGGFVRDEAFGGEFDDLRIWDRVLDATEIAANHRQALGGDEAGLLALYEFEEAGGTTIIDGSPNGNDGTLGSGTPASEPQRVASSDTHVDIAVSDLGRRVIYRPDTGFAGRDGISYSVSDPVETSVPQLLAINVRPTNQLPVANDDLDVPVVQDFMAIIDPRDNDSDADGDELRVLLLAQPANGVVEGNPDGTLTYTPNVGFSGSDTFTYALADEEAWNRSADFTPGLIADSFFGNPDDGSFGIPVWLYEHGRGGARGSGDEWFRNGRTRMVWDPSWLGGGTGTWAQANDKHADIRMNSFQHNLSSDSDTSFRSIGFASWTNPFADYPIDVLGELVVRWSGSGGTGSPTDVDVVIARQRAFDGAIVPLLEQTVSKPTPADTIDEELALPVDLRGLTLDQGDQILVSLRARDQLVSRWVLLFDRIHILPASATNTATVTLDVQPNSAPITTAMPNAHGLEFLGDRSQVNLGNPPELQIAGDQTIEMWLKPANFSARRNPWNKAYAGEGTITQETSGSLNYFYGNLGADSGAGGVNYQAIGSPPLELDRWTHVAIVRDLPDGGLRWYFNGELVREVAALFPTAVTGAQPALIGNGYTEGYAGCIDEVRVWNIARSQSEIQSTLNTRLGGAEPGLAGYWPFEEGSGGQTADLSPAGNTGTLGGGASGPGWVDSLPPFDNALAATEDNDFTLILDGSDADGDLLVATVTRLPANGELFQTDDGIARGSLIDSIPALVTDAQRRVIFVPTADFDGFDSLSYTVSDGKVDSAEGTFTIAVAPVNDPPVAVDDAYDTVEDVPITTGNVFANDSDVENDPIDVESFTQPASGGSVSYNGDGTFNYTPGAGFIGGDFFEYRLSDGADVGNFARVDVLVNAVDEFVWNNPAGGSWHTASNWTPNAVPEAGHRAVIALDGDYTVTVSQTTTIGVIHAGASAGTQTLQLTGGTFTISNEGIFGVSTRYRQTSGILRGSAPVLFEGAVEWIGGDIRDAGVRTVRGTFTVSPASSVSLRSNGALANEGTILFAGPGDFYVYEGATIYNAAAAIFDVRTDADMRNSGSNRARLTNLGTMRKSAGTGESYCEWIVDNVGGSVEVQAGGLDFRGGGTNTAASYTAAAAASVQFNGLTHSMDAVTTVTGDGGLFVQGGSVDWNGMIDVSGPSGVSGGTLQVDGTATFSGGFSQSGGDLRGTGTVFLDGAANTWTGGNIRDPGPKTVRGTLTVSPVSSVSLRSSGALVNQGTIVFDGPGAFFAYEGATVENAAGAIFDVRTDADMRHSNDALARLTNEGTLRKSAGSGESYCDWIVDNAGGSVEVQTGGLDFRGGGTNTAASYTAAAGASVQFNGLTHTMDAATTLTGDGGLFVQGGTVDWDGTIDVSGTSGVSGGTLRVDGTATFTGNHSQSAGDLRGTGTVFLDGAANTWTGGNIRDPGPKTVRGTLAVSPVSSVSLRTSGALVNVGTITFDGPGDFYAYEGASVENAAGATFDLRTDADMRHSSGNRARLTNASGGTLRKSAGGGESYCAWIVDNAGGSVEVQTGGLDFRGGGTNTAASYTAAAGASVQFNGLTHTMDAATTLTGDGGLFVQGGTVDWDGTIDVSGTSGVSGGTLRVDGTATFTGNHSQSAGDLRGTGTLFLDGAANTWTGGNIRDPGPKTVRGTLAVSPVSSVSLRSSGALVNEGTITFDGPGDFYAYEGASVDNTVGATFDVRTDADMRHSNGDVAQFTNDGTLRKSADGGETYCDWHVTNLGLLSAGTGTLRFTNSGSFTQSTASALTLLNGGALSFNTTPAFDDGVVTGSGTISGNLRNSAATIRPGSPTGSLTLTGNYVQLAGGTLEIDINDHPDTGDFDQFVVNGTATLDGSFALNVNAAFAADPGDAFDVFQYGSRTGQFASLTGLDPGNGVSYVEAYATDRFTLTAVATAEAALEASALYAENYDEWAERVAADAGIETWSDQMGSDPDKDGRNNLLEYAFSTDPLAPDRHEFPLIELVESDGGIHVRCTYCVRYLKSDLQIRCQRSDDLKTWSTDGLTEVQRLPGPDGTNSQMITVQTTVPLATDAAIYLRIHVLSTD